MRILFSSYAFRPGVGGIETVSAILAEQFAAAGHNVELITETPGPDVDEYCYRVVRRPTLRKLIERLRWADIFFQNNISLRSLLPALLLRKPAIVVHQTWIRDTRGKIAWNARFKRLVLGQVTNVAISRAVAADLAAKCLIIPNPYRDDLFQIIPGAARDKSIVFVGRLVTDKGVDLLLRALEHLRRENLRPDLTIIGSGPEAEELAAINRDLRLQDQVVFVGQKTGEELVQSLNQHRIMVLPSRWAEPFGVAALEGIACGCVLAGSEAGGLKEAIGPCGITFENRDHVSLAAALKGLLLDSALEESLRAAASSHLARFKQREVARSYLQLIEKSGR